MSEEFKSIVDTSYDKGNPLWIFTTDYIYGMIPTDNDRWIEVSYTFEDPDEPLVTSERNADLSFQFLFEELGKGINYYVEDFKVVTLKEFANTLEGKPGSDKIKAVIEELINNSEKYSANMPIIKSKDDVQTLKDKV
jgi:hypothetical protein